MLPLCVNLKMITIKC